MVIEESVRPLLRPVDDATSLVRAQTGKRSRKGQGVAVVYDEEEVKSQVRNVVEKVKESYVSLNHGREVAIGIGSDSLLLQMVACTLVGKIRNGDGLLETISISTTLRNLLCVSEGTYTCRRGLVSILRGQASALGTLPTFDSRGSMGSLLALLDENKSINELKVLDKEGQMTGVLDAVRHVDSIEKNTYGYRTTQIICYSRSVLQELPHYPCQCLDWRESLIFLADGSNIPIPHRTIRS